MVHRRHAGRAPPEPGRRLRVGARPSAAPRRRALPRARRPRCRGARLRVGRGPVGRAPAPASRDPTRSSSVSGTSRGSTVSPRRWHWRATSASTGWTSVASSPSGAASSTSSPRPAASPSGSSCSATRSSRCARSRRSRSARCTRPTTSSCIPRPSGAQTSSSSTWGQRRTVSRPPPSVPATSCRRSAAPPDIVWQPDETRRVADEEGLPPVALDGATELDPFPQGQPHAFEAQRPAVAARGLAEAENELAAFVRSGNRVVVSFAHRGEAERQAALLRKVEAPILTPGEPLAARTGRPLRGRAGAARVRVAGARPRPAPRHAGLPQAAPARRQAPRTRARELRRPTGRRLRRPRGPRCRQAPRLRDEGGRGCHSRLPLSGDFGARTGSTSRTSSSESSPGTSAPTRERRPSRSSAARHGRTSRRGPGMQYASSPASFSSCTPSASGPRAWRTTSRATGSSGSRRRSPTARRRISGARSRPSTRTSSRRGRWTAWCAATWASGRPRSPCGPHSRSRSTAGRCSCSARRRSSRSSTGTPSSARYRDFPVRVEMVSRFRKPAEVEERAARVHRGKGRGARGHAPRSSPAT